MRKKTGSNVVEIAVSAVAIAVMTVLCVDVAVVCFGSAVHDRCCREACRAAAQASSQQSAMQAAQAVISASRTDGYYVAQPTFQNSDMTYQTYNNNPAPGQVPYVSLTTHSQVRIPAPFGFDHAFFNTSNGLINSTCNYVFPLTNYGTTTSSGNPNSSGS